MKRCPTCDRTFDALNFCPTDGTPLVAAALSQSQPPSYAQPTAPIQSAPTTNWSQQPGPATYGQQFQQPQQSKRKIWPWVLGVVALFVVGGTLIAGGLAYVGYRAVKKAEAEKSRRLASAPARRAGTQTYTNSRSNFTGKLAEHYADFSFDYPATWKLDAKAGKGTSPNFVKVERAKTEGGGNFTLENFAVGWYTSTGTAEGDSALFPQLAAQLSSQFSQGFPGYEKVSEGRTRVGAYDGYEFRFKSLAKDTPKGDVEFYGRAVMLPGGSASQRNGVALIMLASSLAPGIDGPEDIGVAGETPVILESFRLGTNGGSASGAAINSSAGAPTDEAEVLEQLKEIEDEWSRANMEGDKAALAEILAEDYVGTSADGTRQTKQEYVGTLKPDTSIRRQTYKDLDLTLAGDTATLSGVTTLTFKNGTQGDYTFTDVFKWRDGRWQAVTSTAAPAQ